MKDAGVGYFIQGHWMSDPIDQFLTSNEVNVRESQNGVNELEKSFLPMWAIEEPSGVEKERERRF